MLRKSLVIFAVSLSLIAGSARADAVVDWNAIASQVIAAGGRPGPSTLLDFAVVHAAIFDAVQAIDGRYRPYHAVIPGASGSPVAATAKAARDVLVQRFPAQAASINATYESYLVSKGVASDDPGLAVGAAAAASIIALRANDGAFPTSQTPFTGAGDAGPPTHGSRRCAAAWD